MELLSKKETNKPTNLPKRNTQAGSFMRLCFLSAKEGERNNVAAKVAGSICRTGTSYNSGLDVLRLWNHSSCRPVMDDTELCAVWASIFNKHLANLKKVPNGNDKGQGQVT